MDLSPENLLSVLSVSLDDADARNKATQQLSAWESISGFHSMLQDAYFDENLKFETRYQAIIYLKNCVARNWRRTSNNALSSEERDHIRSRLFQNLNIKRLLASQNVVIIAKIARIDFPRDWPGLFEEVQHILHQVSRTPDQTAVYNAYDILVQVIKTISKVKIGRRKSDMQAKVESIIGMTIQKYTELVEQWTQTMDPSQMELSALVLKCLCVMLVQGFEHVNRNSDASTLFSGLVTQFQELTQLANAGSSENEWLDKHIKVMSKMFLRLASAQPASFVLLEKSSDITHYAFTLIVNVMDKQDPEFWDKICINGLSLVEVLIKTRHGSNSVPRRSEEDRQEAKLALEKLNTDIFTELFVQNATSQLLTQSMAFRQRDFEEWQDDPEGFFLTGASVTWEHQLRSCSGKLFGAFVVHFRDVVSQNVADFITNTLQTSSDPVQLEVALYALQEASPEMPNKLDFNDLYKTRIITLKDNKPENLFLIVRRRICRLISEWVAVDCNDESRELTYRALKQFLDEETTDLVVQLETMSAIRLMVDDWKFDAAIIQPYAETIIHHLFRLISVVESVEVQSTLLNTLSVLIEQIGPLMKPHFGTVMKLLPGTWNYEPLKPVVLQILTSLVAEVGDLAVDSVVPVLSEVFSNSSNVLVEDALPLWTVIISRCHKSREEVLKLVPLLVHGLETRAELFEEYLKVLDEYVLLDYKAVVGQYGTQVFKALAVGLEDMKLDTIDYVCKVLDSLTLVAPLQLYAEPMVQSGLFEALGRQGMSKRIEGYHTVSIFCIFSRMAISDSQMLWALVNRSEQWWYRWIDQFERIGSPSDQKLYALGFTMMLKNNDPVLVESIGALLGIWYAVLDTYGDDSEAGESNLDEAEIARRQMDPVFYKPLKEEIKTVVTSLYQDSNLGRLIDDRLGNDRETLQKMVL